MSLQELADELVRIALRLYESGELADAAAVEDCAAKLSDAIRWIPCAERLPSDTDSYLVVVSGVVTVGSFTQATAEWWWRGSKTNVTHWAPLPDPPDQA